MLKGRLQLHGDLIDALKNLPRAESSDALDMRTREKVLEQTLIEQNQVLDMMQKLISTLESENQYCREKVNSQAKFIRDLADWESKAKKAGKELEELKKGLKSSRPLMELRKELEMKNQTIQSLNWRLNSSGKDSESMKLSSTRTKLELERVHCIELSEELSQKNGEIALLKRTLDEKESDNIKNVSEILHLTHELDTLKKFEQQQQDLIMKQRSSLAEKGARLSTFALALNKEKQIVDQLMRKLRLQSSSAQSILPKVSDSFISPESSLFDQLSGRHTWTIELTKDTEETELGFSFATVDLPVSSRVPCLVINKVKEDSLAAGILEPGDELLEVNGVLCRSTQQSKAIYFLKHGMGTLKIVVSRARMASKNHTQMKRAPSDDTRLWATHISPLKSENATFENFSVDTASGSVEFSSPKYITVPSEAYSITVSVKESSVNGDHSEADLSAPNGSMGGVTISPKSLISDPYPISSSEGSLEDRPQKTHPISSSEGSLEDQLQTTNTEWHQPQIISTTSESLQVPSAMNHLQSQIYKLQYQLDESERTRLSLDSELVATCTEMDHLRKEYEVTKSDSCELKYQLSFNESEINDIKQYVRDLQSALVTLEGQIADEQQKYASMENQNKVISNELVEAKNAAIHAAELKEALEHEIKRLKEQDQEEKVQQLNLKITELASKSSRLFREKGELEHSFDSFRKESEETVTALNCEIKELQSQLELTKAISEQNVINSQEEYGNLTAQLKSTKTKLNKAKMEEDKLKSDMEHLQHTADLANKQLEKVENEYLKSRDESRQYKQQLEAKTLELESMTVGIKGCQLKLETKQEMVSRLQEKVDSLRRDNSQLRNEVVQLQDEANKMDLNLTNSRAEEERLEKKLEASLKEKDELFKQLEKAFEDSTELSKMVEVLTAQQTVKVAKEDEVCSSQEEVMKGDFKIKRSQKTIQMACEQSSKMRNEMKVLVSELEKNVLEVQQLKTENMQLHSSKEELQKQLMERQESYDRICQELDHKQQELTDATISMVQLEEQVRVEQQRSDGHVVRISELESELNRLMAEMKQNENVVASLESIRKLDQDKLEQSELIISNKEEEISRLNDEIEHVSTNLRISKLDQKTLNTSISTIQQQLEERERTYGEEIKDMKEQLAAREKVFERQMNKIQETANANDVLETKLKESLERFNEEKNLLQRKMDESADESRQSQSLIKTLQGKVTSLQLELDQMTATADSLSSECAGLRQQSQQNEQELDQLKIQLDATERDLNTTQRALEKSEQIKASQLEKLEDSEFRYEDVQQEFQDLAAKYEASTFYVLEKDEEISKHKASLELRQSECHQLQNSLVTLRSAAEDSEQRCQELKEESKRLFFTIGELQGKIMELENSLKKVKREREKERTQHTLETQRHLEEIDALKLKEKELLDQNTLLVYSQEELKESVGKLGDEKDKEIIKSKEVERDLKAKLNALAEDLDVSSKKEQDLSRHIIQLEQRHAAIQDELKEKNRKLKIKMFQASEKETIELNERVTLLDQALKEKSAKLSELQKLYELSASNLNALESENEALQEKIVELSTLKIFTVQQSNKLDSLHKILEEKEAILKELQEERSYFLSKVREYEIKQHSSRQAVTVASIDDFTTSDPEKLIARLRQKEDEIARTREYTENLLINVMMKAPFLLEKLNFTANN